MLPMRPAAAADRSSLPFHGRSNRRQQPGSPCHRPPFLTSSRLSPSMTRWALRSESTAAGLMTSVTVTSAYMRLARLSTASRWETPGCFSSLMPRVTCSRSGRRSSVTPYIDALGSALRAFSLRMFGTHGPLFRGYAEVDRIRPTKSPRGRRHASAQLLRPGHPELGRSFDDRPRGREDLLRRAVRLDLR